MTVFLHSGQGPTDDFSAETAPFLDYSRDIHTLVIEDGITYIGSCLFYGLGSLKGELILPGSIIGFGDYAFSGADIENAPKFTVIRNEFKSAEIMEDVQQDNSGAEDTGERSDTGAGENADGISDAEPDAGVKESTGSDAEEETAQKAQAEEAGVEEGADATWNQDMTESSSDEPDKAAGEFPVQEQHLMRMQYHPHPCMIVQDYLYHRIWVRQMCRKSRMKYKAKLFFSRK